MGVFGSLIAYMIVVTDLPARIYTTAQKEYLSYNDSLRINQAALLWNEVLPSGEVVPAELTGWESRVQASLEARYEEQQGINVAIYDLGFQSEYHFTYPGPAITTTVTLFFPFPSNLETLHEVQFLADGKEPPEAQYSISGISWQTELRAGEEHTIAIRYRADGANSFSYALSRDRRADVDVSVLVSGVSGSHVPRISLPTSDTSADANGETFYWQYEGLIPNRDIRLELPTPTSFTQRVMLLQEKFRLLSGLSPFLICFFLLSLAVVCNLGGIRLRLEAYLLIGFCLALFYPALTFLSGLVDLWLASIISFLGISGFVIVFLGLLIGWRPAWWRAAWLLVIFLGIFSLGLFTPWRGLMFTVGGILLIGTFMLGYALRPKSLLAQEEPETEHTVHLQSSPQPDEEPGGAAIQIKLDEVNFHCPSCGRLIAEDYHFCPGCGHDAHCISQCKNCGYRQFIRLDLKPVYCLQCGNVLVEEKQKAKHI